MGAGASRNSDFLDRGRNISASPTRVFSKTGSHSGRFHRHFPPEARESSRVASVRSSGRPDARGGCPGLPRNMKRSQTEGSGAVLHPNDNHRKTTAWRSVGDLERWAGSITGDNGLPDARDLDHSASRPRPIRGRLVRERARCPILAADLFPRASVAGIRA
jgi:hypothetical protein